MRACENGELAQNKKTEVEWGRFISPLSRRLSRPILMHLANQNYSGLEVNLLWSFDSIRCFLFAIRVFQRLFRLSCNWLGGASQHFSLPSPCTHGSSNEKCQSSSLASEAWTSTGWTVHILFLRFGRRNTKTSCSLNERLCWSPFVCRIRYLKKIMIFSKQFPEYQILIFSDKNKVRKTLVHVMSSKRLAELLPCPLIPGVQRMP